MTDALMARRTALHSASTKVVADWTALMPGDFVTVLESYTVPHSGWIDDHILDEQYWRIGPYLHEDLTLEGLRLLWELNA